MGRKRLQENVYEGFSKLVPPVFDFVCIYFDQKHCPQSEAEKFFKFYTDNNWKTITGKPVIHWKRAANDWIWNYHLRHRKTTKRK